MNVPSKDFGEKVEVVHHVPEIDAVELNERIESGEELVILDTRTPEEYQRLCIPGGRSVPGAELALRITDITKDLSDDATVVINCAGRTRSIIGTRVLQRMGMPNVVGLKNGTAGWSLAGYSLEAGADRLELPELSEEGIAAAEAYADRLAEEDGVQYIDVEGLQALMARRSDETVYLVDVRTEEEYADGHIPGFRWFPGGQTVQRSDEVAVVKNCPIVFCCDGRARAAITASWYRQMGHEHVYALHGGTGAWQGAEQALEQGTFADAGAWDGGGAGRKFGCLRRPKCQPQPMLRLRLWTPVGDLRHTSGRRPRRPLSSWGRASSSRRGIYPARAGCRAGGLRRRLGMLRRRSLRLSSLHAVTGSHRRLRVRRWRMRAMQTMSPCWKVGCGRGERQGAMWSRGFPG